MTTAPANSWCSFSMPGVRPTRPRSRAASGCPRSCFLKYSVILSGRTAAIEGCGPSDTAVVLRGLLHPHLKVTEWVAEYGMSINAIYKGPGDLPAEIAVFPLPGALLLPRGQMPLNIFEPRYLAMIDDAMRSGTRVIGMIQPDPAHPGPDPNKPHLFGVGCAGRITQLAESGNGRYLIQLTGICRYRLEQELAVGTPYRQCRVSYAPFIADFTARKGEDEVDRKALLRTLAEFLRVNDLKADWDGIENAPNEALVNALAMMSPYGPAEKQALLEAPDLKTRAEILIAVTEIELAKGKTGETPLQ